MRFLCVIFTCIHAQAHPIRHSLTYTRRTTGAITDSHCEKVFEFVHVVFGEANIWTGRTTMFSGNVAR